VNSAFGDMDLRDEDEDGCCDGLYLCTVDCLCLNCEDERQACGFCPYCHGHGCSRCLSTGMSGYTPEPAQGERA
jgi:hypothetical protein